MVEYLAQSIRATIGVQKLVKCDESVRWNNAIAQLMNWQRELVA
jgi:hypothetical protein